MSGGVWGENAQPSRLVVELAELPVVKFHLLRLAALLAFEDAGHRPKAHSVSASGHQGKAFQIAKMEKLFIELAIPAGLSPNLPRPLKPVCHG